MPDKMSIYNFPNELIVVTLKIRCLREDRICRTYSRTDWETDHADPIPTKPLAGRSTSHRKRRTVRENDSGQARGVVHRRVAVGRAQGAVAVVETIDPTRIVRKGIPVALEQENDVVVPLLKGVHRILKVPLEEVAQYPHVGEGFIVARVGTADQAGVVC
mgnify:CR=1 FL=1